MKVSAREREIYRVTLIGSIVNCLLIVVKFIAGFAGRSSAMIADAVHSLSDFVTDVIVLVFVKISGKPQDSTHDYGHGKFETLATLIVGLILIVIGVFVLADGVNLVMISIRGVVLPKPSAIALIVAVLSIVLKEGIFRYTISKGRELESQVVIANAWHHRSDAFSSIGTLVGISGAMFLGERWRILDPIAAIIVSSFILKVGYDIMKPCVAELLECSLSDETEQEISRIILSVDGIDKFHKLRTRRIGNSIAIEVHILMDGNMNLFQAHEVANEVESRIKKKFGESTHIGIHMEPSNR